MIDLPPNWTRTPLANLLYGVEAGLNVKCEERPPEAGERGLVKISAVTWGRFDEHQSKTLPPDERPDANRRIAVGDLLLSRANTYELVGACVIVNKLSRDLFLSDKVLRLRVHEPSKRWINYALKTPALRHAISEASSGNQLSMRNLPQDKLRQLELPLAPEAEQERITDRLDTVLARVDAVNTRLARVAPLLKRFRQSVLSCATNGDLTSDWRRAVPDTSPWKQVPLGEVAFGFSYGSAAKSSAAGAVPVLRMGNIQDGRLDWANLVYTSNLDEIEKYSLRKGDVLFNRTNSPELVGKAAVYQGEREAIYAGYLIRVRCSDPLVPEYLNAYLGGPAGRSYCWSVKSDGVSQSNINAKKLAAMPIPLPSRAEQAEIVRRIDLLFAFADRLEARLQAARAAATRLTPALLAKAFRGELVPQDPADEPATELLKRLAAQRASAASAGKPGRRATAVR